MNYDNIIERVAKELNLPKEYVDKVYKAYWTSIKETIVNLPLKESLEPHSFDSLRKNFNIPSLGKLCITNERYYSAKKRFELISKLKDNDKAEED